MDQTKEHSICPKCGKENSRYALICGKCLAPLQDTDFDLSIKDTLAADLAGSAASLRGDLKAEYEKITAELKARVQAPLRDSRNPGRDVRSPVFPSGRPWPEPAAVFGRKDLRRHPELEAIDRIMDEDFALRSRLAGASSDYPTVYCETLEEYFDPYVKILNLSETTRKEIVQHLIARAEADAENTGGGGEFGVNWPGQGCFVNGWLFAYRRAADAAAALRDPATLPFILATVAHEKHGHGFITEFTMSGREKKDIQMFRQDLAARFNVRLADTPDDVLLREKWSILFMSSVFLEEGWSVWVENYLLRRLRESGSRGPDWTRMKDRRQYRLEAVAPLLARLAGRGGEKAAAARTCGEAVDFIFRGDVLDEEKTLRACRGLEETEAVLADDFASAFGQYPRYVLGYLLVEKVERAVGTANVPYAVAIAANVRYGLASIANSDLARVAASEPRLNLNARLALLSGLDLKAKGDPTELAARAREELNFKIPENLKI